MATETIRRSKRIQNQTNPDIDDIFTSPDERLFKKKLLNANFMGNGYLIFNKYQGINVQVTYLDQILRLRTSAGYDDIDLIQTIVEKYSVEKIRDICELSIECIVSIIDEENKLTFEQFTAESGTDEIAAKVIKILRNNILYCQNKIDAILPKMKIFVDYTADMNCSLNKFVEWMKNNNIHHDYRIDNLETAIQQLNIATLSALCNTKLSDVSKLPIVYSSQFAHVVQAGIKKRFQNLINWFYIAINEYKKSDINKDNEEILEDIEMMSHNNNNMNNTNSNSDRNKRRTKLLQKITREKLKVCDLKEILRKNGKIIGGRKDELIERIISDNEIDFNVLNVDITQTSEQTPVHSIINDTQSTDNNDNDNDDNDNNERRHTEHEHRLLRDKCVIKIQQAQKKMKELENILMILMRQNIISDNDTTNDIINELNELLNDIEELYRKVPRRFRNQYPCEFIDCRTKRQKKFNNVAPKLLKESAKLAIQTRALIGMWAVSADTIGVDPRSKPSVWISAQNQIADFGACTQIVANIKQIVNNFTNDRMNIKENHKLKEKDLIIKLLVQTAIENDGNSQAVIDKAKALNLGDLLKDLIDDDYDLEIIATEIDESNDNHN